MSEAEKANSKAKATDTPITSAKRPAMKSEGSTSNRSVKFAPDTKPPVTRTPIRRNNQHGRSSRQKVGKANLKRDIPIFLSIFGFLFYVAWSAGDIGKPASKEEKKKLSIFEIRKELAALTTDFKREEAGRRRKSECGLFMASSTIPSAGLSWFAGQNFEPGDLVLEEGLPLRETVDGHAVMQHELLMKHHPFMVNVKRRNDDGTGPYVATRSIEQGEELFLSYESHPHSKMNNDVAVFHDIPLLSEYELAEDIFIIEVKTQIYGPGGSASSRKTARRGLIDRSAGGDKALKMVMESVRLLNRRVANLLPFKTEEMREDFATSRHYAYNIVNNRTVYWLEIQGKCMDDVVVRDGSLFAKRPIKKKGLIVIAPLHITRRPAREEECKVTEGEETCVSTVEERPSELRGACFGHATSPLLMCPFSSASSLKYITTAADGDTIITNAKYQWGGWNERNHQSRYWQSHDLIDERATGQTMDIVATEDIAAGDEILLDVSLNTIASDSVVEMDDYYVPKGWR